MYSLQKQRCTVIGMNDNPSQEGFHIGALRHSDGSWPHAGKFGKLVLCHQQEAHGEPGK